MNDILRCGRPWGRTRSALAVAAVAAAVVWPVPGAAQETAVDRIASADSVGLELAWRRDLGSGNSRVAVADGIAVTFFSDGNADQVIALDAATGRQRWLYRIADTYRGHDASRDGPNGSPLIHEGVVYGLGPTGRLFAVALEDGTELWSLDLADGHVPFWGFASTPVVADGVLVVPTGGPPAGSISGFDPGSGRRLWSAGDDHVDYQSPAVMTLAGVEQVVATTNRWVLGIAPRTGQQLWSFQHREDDGANGTSQAVAVGQNRFLLTASSGEQFSNAMLFRVEQGNEGFTAERMWESPALGFTFAVPIRAGAHLYGFQRDFLTCVDLATGEAVWKSRQPGGNGLTLVDDRLVILGRGGEVVVSRAASEGYLELARVAALGRTAYPAPTVQDGLVLVRSHDEIAAVRILETAAVTTGPAELELDVGSGAFAGLLQRLAAMPEAERAAAIDEFIGRQPRIPVVEEDGAVHFLYRGPAADVAVQGLGDFANVGDQMRRVPGTDLCYRTYRLEAGGRYAYWLLVDGDFRHDPLNADRGLGRWNPSQVAMPGWERPEYLRDPTGPTGSVETFEFDSPGLGNVRDVEVYLPTGYAESGEPYPLLVVVDGPDFASAIEMRQALDNLIGRRVQPLVVAFVGYSKAEPVATAEGGPDPYREYGGVDAAKFADALADELVPLLAGRYRIAPGAAARAVFGTESKGLSALLAAASHPDVFGKVAVQSLWFGPSIRQSSRAMPRPIYQSTLEALRSLSGDRPTVYLDWAAAEMRSHQLDVDITADNVELARTLQEWGYRVLGGQYPGGSGAGSWNARLGDLLTSLFPADPGR